MRRLALLIAGFGVCYMSLGAAVAGADVPLWAEPRLRQIKEQFGFAKWAGKVRIPAEALKTVQINQDMVSAFGPARFRPANNGRSLSISMAEEGCAGIDGVSVSIDALDSAMEAHEALVRWFLYVSSPTISYRRAEAGTTYDIGDVCLVPPLPVSLQFTRNNVLVVIRGSRSNQTEAVLELAKATDAELVRLLESGEPVKTVAAGPDNVPSAAAARQPGDPAEAVESVLKAMPDEEARRLCLQRAEEMSKSPDDAPEQLLLFLRGLGPDEDPRQVAVLREIVRRSTNNAVRAQAVRVLAAWVSGTAETREDVLRVLGGLGEDPNPAVRQTVARTIAGSADVRHLPRLTAMMDDENDAVRRSAVEAICGLLGWDRPADADGEAVFRQRIEPVLSALRALEGTINAPAPPE